MMVELLAPAGSLEKLKYAIDYGADAVYVGGSLYSLRANAINFSKEDLVLGLKYAHERKKLVYVAVNIVFHNNDYENVLEYLKFLEEIKVDGVIVSDILVIYLINHYKLNLNIVLSTQASVINYEAAKYYKDLGVKRIVLGREASKEDIKAIKEVGIEVEVFIHGAMCMSISGQCVLSNYFTARDSNRGGCAQVCRWCFKNDKINNFTIMPKDLNMVSHIKELIDLGVSSFKIEGRMRSIYYISTVTLIYRRLIDKIITKTLSDEYTNYALNILKICANRDSAPQFFEKIPGENEQYYLDRMEISNQDFLGLVLGYDKNNKRIKIEERNYFKVGDVVQFFGPSIETFEIKINNIIDIEGNFKDRANHPKEILYIPCEVEVPLGVMMRIKRIDICDKK